MSIHGRWITKPHVALHEDGVRFTLDSDLKYLDPKQLCWVAPKNAQVDGASIPRPFWPLIGSPFRGEYRDASIIHDWYCSTRTRPSKDVHRAFYDAMLCSGTGPRLACLMYAAVRYFGPHWSDMDIHCERLLRASGVTDLKQVTRSLLDEYEDCSENDPKQKYEGEGFSFSAQGEVVSQDQIVYFDPHADADDDFFFLVREVGLREDLLSPDEIDAMIDQRIREHFGKKNTPGDLLEMS